MRLLSLGGLSVCGALLIGGVLATSPQPQIIHLTVQFHNGAQSRCLEEAQRFSVASDVCEAVGRPDWDALNAAHEWIPQPNDCWSWTDQYGFVVVCPDGTVTAP